MKGKRGFELAISTIVLFILGIFVLIGLIYLLSSGFKSFNSTTKPLLESSQAQAIVEACDIACKGENKLTFCCKNFSISGVDYQCRDKKLSIGCSLRCDDFVC